MFWLSPYRSSKKTNLVKWEDGLPTSHQKGIDLIVIPMEGSRRYVVWTGHYLTKPSEVILSGYAR